MKNNWQGADIISAAAFQKDDVLYLFEEAGRMEELVQKKGSGDSLKGRVMGTLFYEPSSRTFGSFVSAIQRLGGGFIPLNGMTNTSVAKGESLEDTAKVFSSYCDTLVIRNPVTGSAQTLADAAPVPVINAGDGTGEHPTQALLDGLTIHKEFGGIENLHIAFVGELAHYRPVNSLVKLLSLFPGIQMSFISLPEAALKQDTRDFLSAKGVPFQESADMEPLISDADVLYVTRTKKEFIPEDVYEKVRGKYIVNGKTLEKMKRRSIIMHALPRLEELSTEVDSDPRAVYMNKMLVNGLYARMALLDLVLRK